VRMFSIIAVCVINLVIGLVSTKPTRQQPLPEFYTQSPRLHRPTPGSVPEPIPGTGQLPSSPCAILLPELPELAPHEVCANFTTFHADDQVHRVGPVCAQICRTTPSFRCSPKLSFGEGTACALAQQESRAAALRPFFRQAA